MISKIPTMEDLAKHLAYTQLVLEDIGQMRHYPADASKCITWDNVHLLDESPTLLTALLDEIAKNAFDADHRASQFMAEYRDWFMRYRQQADADRYTAERGYTGLIETPKKLEDYTVEELRFATLELDEEINIMQQRYQNKKQYLAKLLAEKETAEFSAKHGIQVKDNVLYTDELYTYMLNHSFISVVINRARKAKTGKIKQLLPRSGGVIVVFSGHEYQLPATLVAKLKQAWLEKNQPTTAENTPST